MSNEQNRELLMTAALLLQPLLDELVFVGGCTTSLLITDPGADEVRPTFDVDAIVEINSYAEYVNLSARLRRMGFHEDQTEGAPNCRWCHGNTILDILPTDESILGFSNRWYTLAIKTAERIHLGNDLAIRVVTAPCFLGTKLEAYKGRGENDPAMSRDLEDFIIVVDGRTTVIDEVNHCDTSLRKYISAEIVAMLQNQNVVDVFPGFLGFDSASQARLPLLLEKLKQLMLDPGTDGPDKSET